MAESSPEGKLAVVLSESAREKFRVPDEGIGIPHGSELEAGAVVTAVPRRLRIRPPETLPDPGDGD